MGRQRHCARPLDNLSLSFINSNVSLLECCQFKYCFFLLHNTVCNIFSIKTTAFVYVSCSYYKIILQFGHLTQKDNSNLARVVSLFVEYCFMISC